MCDFINIQITQHTWPLHTTPETSTPVPTGAAASLFSLEGPSRKIAHHLIVVECFSIWLKKARCIKELPAASGVTVNIDKIVAIEESI